MERMRPSGSGRTLIDARLAKGRKLWQGCGIEDLVPHQLAVDREGDAVRPGHGQGRGQAPDRPRASATS